MVSESIQARFRDLGTLERTQINQLHYDIMRVLVNMQMALYEERGSSFLRNREQEPERNALSAMAQQVREEALRRGMMWIDTDTAEGGRKPYLIVPLERVIDRVRELESDVDKMMRETLHGA